MDDIVAFLNDRLAEDEGVARAATPGPWRERDDTGLFDTEIDAIHISRWDPTHVLAEVDAKRRIIVRCQEEMFSGIPRLIHFCQQTLWEMAKPYSDHPEFQEAWRP